MTGPVLITMIDHQNYENRTGTTGFPEFAVFLAHSKGPIAHGKKRTANSGRQSQVCRVPLIGHTVKPLSCVALQHLQFPPTAIFEVFRPTPKCSSLSVLRWRGRCRVATRQHALEGWWISRPLVLPRHLCKFCRKVLYFIDILLYVLAVLFSVLKYYV